MSIDPDRLTQLRDLALQTLSDNAEAGDTRAAAKLADIAAAEHRGKLSAPIEVESLSNMDEVLAAAQRVTEMVANAKLGFAEGRSALGLLRGYAELRAFEKIDELRLAIEQLDEMRHERPKVPKEFLPVWGKLRAGPEH